MGRDTLGGWALGMGVFGTGMSRSEITPMPMGAGEAVTFVTRKSPRGPKEGIF